MLVISQRLHKRENLRRNFAKAEEAWARGRPKFAFLASSRSCVRFRREAALYLVVQVEGVGVVLLYCGHWHLSLDLWSKSRRRVALGTFTATGNYEIAKRIHRPGPHGAQLAIITSIIPRHYMLLWRQWGSSRASGRPRTKTKTQTIGDQFLRQHSASAQRKLVKLENKFSCWKKSKNLAIIYMLKSLNVAFRIRALIGS